VSKPTAPCHVGRHRAAHAQNIGPGARQGPDRRYAYVRSRVGESEIGLARRAASIRGGGPQGRARLFLSEHRGDARPDTLVGLFVNDIDAVVAEFGRPEEEPPYGCEFELRDPDGNRLRISKRAT